MVHPPLVSAIIALTCDLNVAEQHRMSALAAELGVAYEQTYKISVDNDGLNRTATSGSTAPDESIPLTPLQARLRNPVASRAPCGYNLS